MHDAACLQVTDELMPCHHNPWLSLLTLQKSVLCSSENTVAKSIVATGGSFTRINDGKSGENKRKQFPVLNDKERQALEVGKVSTRIFAACNAENNASGPNNSKRLAAENEA
jgi:hypothetical protein